MAQKSFFKERTAKQIKELDVSEAYHQRGLVKNIMELEPKQALEVRTPITPGQFRRKATGSEASRKSFKHGSFIKLFIPKTQTDAYDCSEIPLAIRKEDFEKLQDVKEEEIDLIGYFTQVDWGDRRKRFFPFVFMPEGQKLFAYSEKLAGGIGIKPYEDAEKVRTEGASVVVSVPSRTEKKPRYSFKLLHVPMIRGKENLATILQMKPALIIDEETGEPKEGRPDHELYNIRYTWATDRERSEVQTFYPHDVAAYLKIAKNEWQEHNHTPMEMNPFALFSKQGLDYYKKLCNNIVIYDPTLKSEDKLRKLHLDEKSILLARGLGKLGNDNFTYWDIARDGKMEDYDWSVPEGD